MSQETVAERSVVEETTAGEAGNSYKRDPARDTLHHIVVVGRHRETADLRAYSERGVHVVRRPRHWNSFDAVTDAEGRRSARKGEQAVDQLRAILVVQVEIVAKVVAVRKVGPG